MDVVLKYQGVECIPEIKIPGSKSVAARALILDFIAGNSVSLLNLPDCDDTKELSSALRQLRKELEGVNIDALRDREGRTVYNLGNGGTSFRFFTALAASIEGIKARIVCSRGLSNRPISPLIKSLVRLGASVQIVGYDEDRQILVDGKTLYPSCDICVNSEISSQFLSAMMLVSKLWRGDAKLLVGNKVVSESYIRMTQNIINEFARNPEEYTIEGDWSSAAFFYEYVLISGNSVLLNGLRAPEETCQGDSLVTTIMQQLGVNTVVENGNLKLNKISKKYPKNLVINLKDSPDLVPALVFGLCLSDIKFELTGVGHLRHKESNRLLALSDELLKAGYVLDVDNESISWHGVKCEVKRPVVFDSHDDHRMAMAEAIASVKLGEIKIINAECVSKSYPAFFEAIKSLGIW